MANEKLTVKKVVVVMVCLVLGCLGVGFLYIGIFVYSLPLTGNATVSWILSLSITLGVPLALFARSEIKKRKKRRKG